MLMSDAEAWRYYREGLGNGLPLGKVFDLSERGLFRFRKHGTQPRLTVKGYLISFR